MGERRRGARRGVTALAVAMVATVLGACAERVGTTDSFPAASARAMLLRAGDLPPGFRLG